LLDKYEQGQTQELLELIQTGFLGQHNVDILDGLDFDFLNSFPLDEPLSLPQPFHQDYSRPNTFGNIQNNVTNSTVNSSNVNNNLAPVHSLGNSASSERMRRESLDSLLLADLLQDYDASADDALLGDAVPATAAGEAYSRSSGYANASAINHSNGNGSGKAERSNSTLYNELFRQFANEARLGPFESTSRDSLDPEPGPAATSGTLLTSAYARCLYVH
jgi:hypothetical protein